MKNIYCILCFICVSVQIGMAQYYGSKKKNWNVSLHAGINNFFGDVSNTKNKLLISDPFTKDFYQNRNFMYQFSIGNDIFPFWNLRFNALYGNIQNESNDLSLKFKSYYTHEFSLLNSFDVFAFTDLYDWHLNIHAGLGLYAFKTTLSNSETNLIIQPKPQQFTYAFSIPFGLGFSYNITDDWKFTFDLMYRWVANDKYDAYASDYKKFEGFSYASLGFQYAFDFPSFQRSSIRRSFKQSGNYGFSAMGVDQTHKVYRRKKQLGNLRPVNDYSKTQKRKYKNINSRIYILKSRRIK
ncbi:MAG: hypothetical protein KBA86_00055 [Bacteroidales bacterium]|nr:hypothetical protein [Bacteroidales bacterium]